MHEDRDRFRFGENWQSFVALVGEEAIAASERGLMRLFPNGEFRGKRVLDIGCGSGLSALAALRLGAAAVDAIDFDPQSAAAAQDLLERFALERWSVKVMSVFDLDPGAYGTYDIVHSWGVLHHTGDLWTAFDRAAAMVARDGRIAVALYRRSPFGRFWRWEKRRYAAAGAATQAAIRTLYKSLFRLGLVATGRNPRRYEAEYRNARGMDWHHDVHDWLGGYPYEEADPDSVAAFLAERGFAMERALAKKPAAWGLFGSHCDEYVALKRR